MKFPILCAAALVSVVWSLPAEVPRAPPDTVGWRPLIVYPNPDEDTVLRHQAVDNAIDDAFELATFGQSDMEFKFDIFFKYFPEDWHERVVALFQNIVPDPITKLGGPIVQRVIILDVNEKPDICKSEDNPELIGEAYTQNFASPADGALLDYSKTFICPTTFKEIYPNPNPNYPEGPAPRITDIRCEDFKFDNGRYRMSNEMNFIGTVIFHEMMHNNLIAVAALKDIEIPGRELYDAMIVDKEGAYGPKGARDLMKRDPDATKFNADSYTWLAMEMLWTALCKDKLAGQDGRFDDPQDN